MPAPNNQNTYTTQRIEQLENNQHAMTQLMDVLSKRMDQFEEFVKEAHTSEIDVAKVLAKLEQKSDSAWWLITFSLSGIVGIGMWALGHFVH